MNSAHQTGRACLQGMLATRLDARAAEWLAARERELAAAPPAAKLAEALSLASRFAPRRPLAPTEAERAAAGVALDGWNPERWTCLEALRVALILAYAECADAALPATLEECFRYADEGELCALYRSLQFLPDGARFAWRSGEGCRTNMGTVFQANACDTGFPARYYDEIAWRQMCVKSIFTGAPLWRVHGLDGRVDSELTRMVLDGAEERRSAGRPISPELWLCVGPFDEARAKRAIAAEIEAGPGPGRTAAILALGRLRATDDLQRLAGSADEDIASAARRALAGEHTQSAWRALREDERQ
ncbi:MAG: EboA domain-containing protein [Planctomycetota bacterium]